MAAVSPSARRPRSERREAILAASVELFARHGTHGVTTRMIAEAASISEGLLYQHFRGKDELFEELQRWCLRETTGAAERLAEVEPSTQTLVRAVYFIVQHIVGKEGCEGGNGAIKRIMLGSLIGDGEFARGFLEVNFNRFIPRLSACVDAAYRAGDLVQRPRQAAVRLWLVHHVAVMTSITLLTEPPVVDHGLRNEALVDEVALFSLRGLGVTEAALKQYFDSKALAAFTKNLLAPAKNSAPPARAARKGERP